MTRYLLTAVVVAVLAGCSGGSPDLTGSWKGENITFEISMDGNLYKVVSNNPTGMLNGTYIGKYEDGVIKVAVPMCGDITYSKEADKLYFCGAKLSRAKK